MEHQKVNLLQARNCKRRRTTSKSFQRLENIDSL